MASNPATSSFVDDLLRVLSPCTLEQAHLLVEKLERKGLNSVEDVKRLKDEQPASWTEIASDLNISVNINFNITGVKDANVSNSNITGLSLRHASTRNSITHIDHSKHVQTRSESDIPGILQQHKCVFIKGISGSGKTRLGLNILAKVAEETGRVPVQLTSSNNWDLIPKSPKHTDEEIPNVKRYVVMIDDIFGPCTLIQSYVDEWAKHFDVMWPEVDRGHVLLVVLSRPEIHASCQHQLEKYKLFEKIQYIDLDKGEFALDKKEKGQMLDTLCKECLKDWEMDSIVRLETGIGFPQCCRFFSHSQEAQKLGVEFFRNPTLYILQEINTLHERGDLGYLVLLVLLMNDGKLLDDDLYFRPKPEFKSLVHDLCECLSKSIEYPTMNQLKQKAISLCGVFFIMTEDGFEFQHQCISDAVFVSISSRDISICMEKCTPRLLVNYVRHCKVDSQTVVTVPRKHHGELVDKLTTILLGEDYKIVLDHPCLYDNNFARYIVEHWQERLLLKTIFEKEHEVEFVICFQGFGPITFSFSFTSLLASLVLKNVSSLVEQLLIKFVSMSFDATIASDILSCAIHVENNTLIRMLLKHVEPTEKSLGVLCHTSNIDRDIVDRIFASVENKLNDIECINELLTNSAIRGNTYLVKLLVDKFGSSYYFLRECSHLLRQIMGIGGLHDRFTTDWDSDKKGELVRILLGTGGCQVDMGRLVWKAAADTNPTLLRVLLEKESVCITKMYQNTKRRVNLQRTSPLHQASLYGSIDCLKLLLDRHIMNNEDEYNSIFINMNVGYDGEDQSISSLHSIGHHVNVKSSHNVDDEEQSFSPLHYAAMSGRVQHLELLISKGADVDSQTSHGRTPLGLAILHGHIEAVKLLLQNKARTNIDLGEVVKRVYQNRKVRYINVMKCLHEFGVNLHLISNLLHHAVFKNDNEVIKFLCDYGLDVNVKDTNGDTVLHVAARQLNVNTVKYLCEEGASVNAVNNYGDTVLHVAAKHSGAVFSVSDTVKYLCDIGLSVNAVNKDGNTALHIAAEHSVVNTVKYLCEKGASVNAVNNDGETLLHRMARSSYHRYHGSEEKLTYLRDDLKMDMNAKDKHGQTPASILAQRDFCNIMANWLIN